MQVEKTRMQGENKFVLHKGSKKDLLK